MKKHLTLLLLLALFLLVTQVASAATTTIYNYSLKNGQEQDIYFSTVRQGDLTVEATFTPNNHGLYQLNLIDLTDNIYDCWITLDARWGRASVGDMKCYVPNAPVANYEIQFINAMGGSLNVTITVTAETQ